jgi:hypothetical protein
MVDNMGHWWLGDFGAVVKAGDAVAETTECEEHRFGRTVAIGESRVTRMVFLCLQGSHLSTL